MKYFLDFIVLALVYFCIFFTRWRREGQAALLLKTTFYIYLSFVLYFTLMPISIALPRIPDHPYVPMNLTPFIDVSYGRGNFLEQILLNIILTIPFGFLFPLIITLNPTPQKPTSSNSTSTKSIPLKFKPSLPKSISKTTPRLLLYTILACFCLSLFIELTQPLLHYYRSSDITDLITNVFGGLIGFLIYLPLRPHLAKLLTRLNKT